MSAALAVGCVVAGWAVLVAATVLDPAAPLLGRRRWRWRAAVWWSYVPVIVLGAFGLSQEADPLPWAGAAGAGAAAAVAGFVAGAGRPFRVVRGLPGVTGVPEESAQRRPALVYVYIWAFSLVPVFALTM